MNVFELFAKISLDTSEYEQGLKNAEGDTEQFQTKAGGKLSKFAELAGKAMSATVKAVGTVAKAGTAAAGALTGLSVKSYASYEQLVGGVETLFGKSASTVESYANQAYKTAGMSANAYMDTVTSFSASLLQGLNGDTKKAAETANLAITDMSDNANKMGTSMELIQNAYQGFAKQNYTMLDNLKLGYGGTQEEMIRLINDSGVLGETIDSLDNVSFDQMIEAIHAVQTNMGITGTTAKEASSTIEGSANSAKAAWSNVLTSLAGGGMDLGTALNEAVDASKTFGDNLIPRIQKTLEGVGQAFQILAPLVVTELPGIAAQILPGMVSAVGSLLGGVGSAIIQYGPTLLESGVSAAIELVNGLASGIPEGLPVLLEQVLPMILSFSEGLKANAGKLIDAGLNLLLSLAEGIANSLPVLIQYVPQIITNIADIINENAPKLIITAGVIILKLAEGLIKAIPTLIKNIPKIIQAIVSVWTAFNWLNLGESVVESIKKGLKELPKKAKEIIKNAVDGIKNTFKGGGIGNVVKTVIDGVKNTFKSGMTAVKSAVTGVLDGIRSAFQNKLDTVKNIVSSAINKIKGFFKFSWSLPKLKLPHPYISGKFSLNPPSVPSFGIRWYKKAMAQPYLLNDATIFGASGDTLLGGGEAGSEMIVGTQTLKDMISEGNGDIAEALAALADTLSVDNLSKAFIKALAASGFAIKLDNREVGRLVRRYV